METSENVVYETVKPRYTVERSHSEYDYWNRQSTWGGWHPDQAFNSLTAAQSYADQQQLLFPDSKFRVVDNEA